MAALASARAFASFSLAMTSFSMVSFFLDGSISQQYFHSSRFLCGLCPFIPQVTMHLFLEYTVLKTPSKRIQLTINTLQLKLQFSCSFHMTALCILSSFTSQRLKHQLDNRQTIIATPLWMTSQLEQLQHLLDNRQTSITTPLWMMPQLQQLKHLMDYRQTIITTPCWMTSQALKPYLLLLQQQQQQCLKSMQ